MSFNGLHTDSIFIYSKNPLASELWLDELIKNCLFNLGGLFSSGFFKLFFSLENSLRVSWLKHFRWAWLIWEKIAKNLRFFRGAEEYLLKNLQLFFVSSIVQIIKTMCVYHVCPTKKWWNPASQGLNSCMPFHNKSLTTDNWKCYQTLSFKHKTFSAACVIDCEFGPYQKNSQFLMELKCM